MKERDGKYKKNNLLILRALKSNRVSSANGIDKLKRKKGKGFLSRKGPSDLLQQDLLLGSTV